jgi:leucyl aminopeptidase
MNITIEESYKKTEMLCFFLEENSIKINSNQKFNLEISNAVTQAVKDNGGKLGKISLVNISEKSLIQRILIAGIGKKENLSDEIFREVSGRIAIKAKDLKLENFSIQHPSNYPNESISKIVEGVKISSYKFDKFKSKKETSRINLTIIAPKNKKNIEKIHQAEIISESVIFAKDISNLPPNECVPETLAKFASNISKNKMKCKIFKKSELKQKGFGGITAVGQGSKNEPRLIIMEHLKGSKKDKPVVLVGKAVTFDTGGISLKPGDKMDEMKFDKCGGCTVLGIMKAVSELKLPINVIGIVPSVENMPGGESYRPGDIIKLYNGKTTEILNTDAEGRLILADAIAYGEKHYSPKAIIDFATLTGACIIALGTNVAAVISNNEYLTKKMIESSKTTSEQIWELPLNQDYMDMINSDVADMKNVGIGRAAGTITAAAFLKNAVEKTPWLHLDIAGVAWTQIATKEKSYNPKGATGFGVRLVLDYLQKLKN